MPPHRDWTRRGAGRALLYWPLVAFILAAAFPALAVPLVVGSGLALLALGLVGGFAGKRWRARRLARARRIVADIAEDVLPGPAPEAADDPDERSTGSDGHAIPAVWPTGRHARRHRTPGTPGTSAAGDDSPGGDGNPVHAGRTHSDAA
ncbi:MULTISPECIES: hypothetical protein [unclassified Pseudonocardia]|uniref:hypothetical protein n=1 Tax=unclassified Pseudonocardia TaxID=2619320 RepID=UPI00095B3421|nr:MULTISPECIES: hypothetical protein [unclassified Pseudonocardia]OLM17553.1 hypothetical protein Ae707Ps1_1812c [Pseudonocardia sp. Ae707_Ps1]